MIETFCILLGCFFIFTTAVGMVRFPDFYCRMHAASKVSSFGIGFLLLAVVIKFNSFDVIAKTLMCLFFIIVTIPIAAHVVTRVAYHLHVESSEETILDEYHTSYKPETVSETIEE